MSQKNVELVRRSLEQWLDGRIGEWTETLDTDIEWDISGYPLPDFPASGSGRDALVDHVASYRRGWNDYKATINELIDGGDDVILILHERARMRGSDITLDRDLAMVWTVRDGRIVLSGCSRAVPRPSKPPGCGSDSQGPGFTRADVS